MVLATATEAEVAVDAPAVELVEQQSAIALAEAEEAEDEEADEVDEEEESEEEEEEEADEESEEEEETEDEEEGMCHRTDRPIVIVCRLSFIDC